MSVRTTVRNKIVTVFQAMKDDQSGRVQQFDVRVKWLTDQETSGSSTYCVVVTDEVRTGFTLDSDQYELSGVLVIYAYDTKDARAKLDQMIEDAIDVLRTAFRGLVNTVHRAAIETITVSEGSTAEGDWPQAVIRWKAQHIRVGVK